MKRISPHIWQLGDIVVEKNSGFARKRVGEIVFITEGKKPKLKLLELAPRSLSPKFAGNYARLRFFNTLQENCRKLKVLNIKKRKVFQLGDVISHRRLQSFRFGIIVGFHHPDGLYSDSWEKGYNGKDIIECVEISGRSGLPRKRDADGKIKKFEIGPAHAKLCEVLPMDQNGGVRIKDYFSLINS
ncbi:MAG: hypothetical protein VW576_00105 [Opitutae bacterium]